MTFHYIRITVVLIVLLTGMFLSVRMKKLTIPAAFTGGLVGFLIFMGSGYMGLLLLIAFFTLGVLATGYGRDKKPRTAAEGNTPERRTSGQVLANGGVAAMMGILALIYPANAHYYDAMMAGSLAAATADTLSAELGMVHGRRFFNILTFKRDTKGLDGVISWEGLFLGLPGAIAIAVLHACFYRFDTTSVVIVTAGMMGNIVDSVLGATLERKGKMGNNFVNFLNTCTGAFVVWLW